MQVIGHYVENAVLNFGSKSYVIEGNRQLRFQELDQLSDRLAKSLLKMGLKRGDRIGVLANNQLEWVISFYAATKIGIAVVALSSRYRENELLYMINHAEIKCIISLSEAQQFSFANFFKSAAGKLPTVMSYIFITFGKKTPSGWCHGQSPTVQVEMNDRQTTG